jgi:hypothetical protein
LDGGGHGESDVYLAESLAKNLFGGGFKLDRAVVGAVAVQEATAQGKAQKEAKTRMVIMAEDLSMRVQLFKRCRMTS